VKRAWFRYAAPIRLTLPALVALLSIVGYVVTSETIRRDRESAAARRVVTDSARTQDVLGRARALVVGLGSFLAGEPRGARRFAQFAAGTTSSVGLVDAMWVERVPGSQRSAYERRLGHPITRATSAGRLEPAPRAASYLPATFTAGTRAAVRPGVDVSAWPALAAAMKSASSMFAVSASKLGSLAGRPGFFLLQGGSFGRGPHSGGYLVVFVPRGWLTASLQSDAHRLAISLDGRRLDGLLRSRPAASARFSTLARRWRTDVGLDPATGLQGLLPWLALAWPCAAALVAFLVARGILRRREIERELERVFTMSLDLLCIAGFDGYLKRVNPAWMRLFGFTEQELLSRPFIEFVHPDDRARTEEAVQVLATGEELVEFENRHLCRDGSARWMQWSSRPILEQGLAYAVARDVTDRKRSEGEQAALRRVATLVARAVAPAEVFDAVTREAGLQCDADLASMDRFEGDGTVTAIAAWSRSGMDELAVGKRFTLEGTSIAAMVSESGRPARLDSYDGASGPLAHRAQALGIRSSVGCPIVVGGRTWGVITASSMREEPFPPDIESRIADFTELVATAVSNAQSQAELMASRARVVATADEARRRVVRELHDGAQQRLVHTIVTLKLAKRAHESRDDADASALVDEALAQAEQANRELRELAHGIIPAVLAQGGLPSGVETLVSRLRVPVTVDVTGERFSHEVEATAYFVIAEALTNVAKHSGAQHAYVRAWVGDGVLHVDVRDDGVGGVRHDGTGLTGLRDRVATLGGKLTVESPPGAGTRIAAMLPLQGRSVPLLHVRDEGRRAAAGQRPGN
jgi:PAS domain S-box-containing protein